MTLSTTFTYRGIRRDGVIVRGTFVGESEADARTRLIGEGVLPFRLAPTREHTRVRARIAAADLALGLRVLANLVDAGLPVARALQVFDELAPSGWRIALPHLRRSVREGHSFGAALSSAPIAIPDLVIGIVRAGEAGAGLAAALAEAATLCESAAETRAAIRAALAYPFAVAIAGAGAVVVLITVVLPRFAKILADIGQTLPASTRTLISVSETVRSAWLPALACAIVGSIAFRMWTASAAGAIRWHTLLLDVPGVRELRLATATARTAQALAALLESGVAIGPALVLAARAAGDNAVAERLRVARHAITGGAPLSQALEQSAAVSRTAIRLIRAGEESGRVAPMLRHAAHIEAQRAERAVRTGVRMLEPMLLLTFASIVGLIAAALLQAIYSVRPTV